MNKVRTKLKILGPRLKFTFENLSVHGPNFLVRKDVHFIYRFIYFLIYVNVWIAAVASIYKYILSYQEDKIRFTTRTNYLDWNTTFPSITICETPNINKILDTVQKMNVENAPNMVVLATDIAYFNGECQSCKYDLDFQGISIDFVDITNIFHSECKDLFISCIWDDKPINCCQHFNSIQTEFGRCFSMNNKQIEVKSPMSYIASSNQRKLGTLQLELSANSEAFLHSQEDVPYWNIEYDRRLSIPFGSSGSIHFSIVDVNNDPDVSFTPPEVRKCRFPNELPENFLGYKHYSYSTCIINCRIEAQLEICNCTSHLAPIEFKPRYCDLDGLKCLTKYYGILKKLKVPGFNETGLNCDCLSSCVEPDYNIVARKISESENELKASSVKFILSNQPYEIVTRQVARTTLDLVVAMGNCFGLGFGGSLLSIAEVFYYICFKQWKYIRETNE
ncbi:sodium channel protein Nach-like [Danaus plexippus]|uniref:sodium channel protein Nach-like n=1 Tax=Danaus plexippus TaxID=13037 RepID=UPI002AB1B2CF|nr:sodium channel protein Nach-like [Danaus plexippus]